MRKVKPYTLSLIMFLSIFLGQAEGNTRFEKSSVTVINSELCLSKKHTHEISRIKQSILDSNDLAKAKSLALAPTIEAIQALDNAALFAPFSDDLRQARLKLENKRQLIESASNIQQVVDKFDGIMLAGLDNDSLASVNAGNIECNYSTGETIAIVIGFILGIIPGIILLVVLC